MSFISVFFFSYQCPDPTKKMVNLKNDTELLDTLVIECLYNGEWSHNLSNFACTECEKPTNPKDGSFVCESSTYQEKSWCHLVS